MIINNKSKQLEKAENLVAQMIMDHEGLLTPDFIKNLLDESKPLLLSPLFNLELSDFEILIKVLEARFVTTVSEGISLINNKDIHDEYWLEKIDVSWSFWKDYKNLLVRQKWPFHVVESMDLITSKILGLLQNPNKEEDWYRKGLVLGHVQSGKTANYIGVISKAADAGYKFIIVIAGIHNSLRSQTQERIEIGFIGRDSKTKKPLGVGKHSPNRTTPVTLTTTESDFNSRLARSVAVELKSLNNTFILVIKKNVSTLKSLYNWLKELNTKNGIEKITDIPMLLIDDEADNASINTSKPDLDPTKTNEEIRKILNLFKKRCYLGYTATPFANIFINPSEYRENLGSDLFPEDFIYCLDAPTNYFGAKKVFQEMDEVGDTKNIEEATYVRKIDDCENYLPIKHKKTIEIVDIPPSLKKAIRLFIISKAIRILWGQGNKHSSMMINVSRFIDVQRDIKLRVEIYLKELCRSIHFNHKLTNALNKEIIKQFWDDFNDEYSQLSVTWEDILAHLDIAASSIKVFLINSNSDEKLDYSSYEKSNDALTAIAVGGIGLSRGLTIEGLIISYIYRNSKMYDTLMQMGRWFGYREEYENLCRIYMSDEAYSWYSHISEATEELRLQLKRMRRENKTPRDFGLYVKAHPDTLTVTALNKMYNASSQSFKVSYDGKLKETYILPDSEKKNNENRELIKELYKKQVINYKIEGRNSIYFDISWEIIQDFLLKFQFHDDFDDYKKILPSFVHEISSDYPKWDIIFKSHDGRKPENGQFISSQDRTIGYGQDNQPKRPSNEKGWYTGKKQRFSSNDDFKVGMKDDINFIEIAQNNAFENNRKDPTYLDYTNARGKPVLVIHQLNLLDKSGSLVAKDIPAISINFPNSSNFKTVDYIVNKTWLDQVEKESLESLDEDFDYDTD